MIKRLLSLLALVSLLVPGSVRAEVYTVQKGDTLTKISALTGVSVQELADTNGISNPNLIFVGDTIEYGTEQLLGAGYTPVTGYESRTTSYISSSATTIPVSGTKDKAGNQIDLSNISTTSTVKVYLNLEPGTSKEEPIVCTGLTAVSWTNCTRGLSFQGSSEVASSTLQKAHNAGAKIILTNIGQFYNQYVAVDGAQDIWGVKTFKNLPVAASATTVPTTGDQLGTKYYIDNVGAGGFTSANVSPLRGLSVDGSVPEKVGVYASSTAGIKFDTSGRVYLDLSYTAKSAPDYGDGSDGVMVFDGTNTYSSFTKTGNVYVQNRDVFASTIYVNSGVEVKVSNFRLYAQTSSTNLGTISNNGNPGLDAVGQTPGMGATSTPAGSMWANCAGGAGGIGGAAGDGSAGTAGSSSVRAIVSTVGVAGGNGGYGAGGSMQLGGASGTNTGTAINTPHSLTSAFNLYDASTTAGGLSITFIPLSISPGTGGGGGGDGAAASTGGGGGGGGACGGFLYFASPVINNSGTISANGGRGGNGGNGAGTRGSGGGGGGGGNGGIVMLVYGALNNSGTLSASAGSPGTGGLHIGVAGDGFTPTTASSGLVVKLSSNP